MILLNMGVFIQEIPISDGAYRDFMDG
jgi:hypothetical protein